MVKLFKQLNKVLRIFVITMALILCCSVYLNADETDSIKDISQFEMAITEKCYDYTGSEIEPVVSIERLQRDIDYVISYKDNIDPGTAIAIIKGIGAYSGEVEIPFTIIPYAPQNLKATLTGNNSVKLQWDGVKGASGYLVYYKQSTGKEYALYDDVAECITNIERLKNHVTYNFKVVSYYRDESDGTVYESENSIIAKILTKKDIKAPKTVKSSLYGYDDVKITWSKVVGASRYYVYYKKKSQTTFKLLGSTTKRYYKKKNLVDGTEYVFRVKPAYKVKGKYYIGYYGTDVSFYSLKKLQLKLQVPDLNRIDINWGNISGATGYQISKSTSKKKTNIISTISGAEANNKTLKVTANKKYYYKIRAYVVSNGKKVYGPWSTVVAYTLSKKYDALGERLYRNGSFLDLIKESGEKLYGYDVFQGSCTDGTYGYYILYNKQLEKCRIAKVKLSNNELVMVSDGLDIHHGNDLTYNAKTNKILAIHLTEIPDTIAVIDPNTLTVDYDIAIEVPISLNGATSSELKEVAGYNAIAYDYDNDRYVLRIRNSGDYLITDGSLNPVEYVPAEVKKHKSAVYAGLDVINGYIASAEAAGTSGGYNLVKLYDWSGNHVETINIRKNYELESVFNVNGKLYAVFYSEYTANNQFVRHNFIYKLNISSKNT